MPKQRKLTVLKSRIAFRGPIFYVTSAIVREPTGVEVRRDIVRHPGSVVILVLDDSGREPRLLLERQYRYAAGARLWELPAGRIDPGESELAAAKRELLEETGYSARSWRRILKFFISPGFLDETHAIWLARDLTRGAAQPEHDEVIAQRFFPLRSAVRMALNGKIRDAKTIAAVLWLDHQQRYQRRRCVP
jgi:ADP-ribose pyrophosphatase